MPLPALSPVFAELPSDDDGYPIVPRMPRFRELVTLIAGGATMTRALTITGIDSQTLLRARRRYPEVAATVDDAMSLSTDAIADEIEELARNCKFEDVSTTRLLVDTLKWKVGRRMGGSRKAPAVEISAPGSTFLVGDVIAAATSRRAAELAEEEGELIEHEDG